MIQDIHRSISTKPSYLQKYIKLLPHAVVKISWFPYMAMLDVECGRTTRPASEIGTRWPHDAQLSERSVLVRDGC